MVRLLGLLMFSTALASANPFGWMWGRITSIGEPPCLVGGAITPRDDSRHRGPVCDSWELDEPGVLSAHVGKVQLANVKDPERFLRLRVEKAFPPTPAVFVSDITKTTAPMTPRLLASQAQANLYRQRLELLAAKASVSCLLAVYEQDRDLLGGRADYRGETRRMHFLQRSGSDKDFRAGMLVSLILATYMSDVEESADARLTAEIRSVCALPSERLR